MDHNRDAGLIIYDADVTAYYQQIYEQDWSLEAVEVIPDELLSFPLQPAAAAPLTGTPAPLYE